jgi:hypothetical protein
MRWSYKTVQYGLKKEGLLGSSFLDEAEVEQSLNEFGQAGWELISLFGMQDGLMAVFKQPLERKNAPVQEPAHEPVLKENSSSPRFSLNSRERNVPDLVVESKIGRREPDVTKVIPKKTEEEGVGSIRIE